MYKVLIVDDEQIIRNGIRKMIPWEKIGVCGVMTAAGGEEALELMERDPPEIMLADIRMTGMDGLSLIQKVNELYPKIRIIVLTGYDNFEYVQQCCRMNVQDFVLKPADEDELSRIIFSQVKELDRLRGIEQHQKVTRRTQGASEQIRLEQALRGLVHGRTLPGEINGILEEYRYQPDQPLRAVIISPAANCIPNWREHIDLLIMSVKNICIELFDARYEGITFEDDDGRIVMALFDYSGFDEAMERMEKLRSLLKDEFGFSPRIVVGYNAEGFAGLSESYLDALHLLREEAFSGEVVQSYKAGRRRRIFGEAYNELKSAIVSNIGNTDKVMRAFDAFTAAAESYDLSVSTVRRCCFDIVCSLYYNFVIDTGNMVDNKLPALLSSLMACNREEACKSTRSFISQLFGGDEESHEIISTAKQYINENLADDLSVANIAARLHITPNYLSRLFKRVSNEGCNEYIVRKRMEMAKFLLTTTNHKTGKIAGMVGYRETNYFSLAFKKHTGFSPTAYRESVR